MAFVDKDSVVTSLINQAKNPTRFLNIFSAKFLALTPEIIKVHFKRPGRLSLPQLQVNLITIKFTQTEFIMRKRLGKLRARLKDASGSKRIDIPTWITYLINQLYDSNLINSETKQVLLKELLQTN